MAKSILDNIAHELSGKWYTIMADETTDLSNTEQMVLCLRHVDDDLEVHEDLIGLHNLESTSADTIVSTIQGILLGLNLSIKNCRGQRCDGAPCQGEDQVFPLNYCSRAPCSLYPLLWTCFELGNSGCTQGNHDHGGNT